jgi:hypothetical protein
LPERGGLEPPTCRQKGPEARQSPQPVEEAPDRAERASARYAKGALEGLQRPWWRRVFGR